MSRDDWSAVPSRDAGAVPDTSSDQEARPDPVTSAATPASGRVDGRPAPRYGEYAPAGWVNPVLAEQERTDRAAAVTSATASAPAASGPSAGRDSGRSGVAKRLGASSGDLFLTVMLLGLAVWTTTGYLQTGRVASQLRRAIEQQYTTLTDPSALTTAAQVNLVGSITILVLTVWWSVVRLRAGKRTAWVPVIGGVVATVLSAVVILVVLLNDPAFVEYARRVQR